MFPHACINCGAVGISQRQFFVDLGFEINHLYDAFPDGAVYMCNVCVREYIDIFMKIIEEQAETLGDITFGERRTDPVFDGYREKLSSIEHRIEQDNLESEPEPAVPLSASFGG